MVVKLLYVYRVAVETISNTEQLAKGTPARWTDGVFWADGLRQNNVHQWLLAGSVHAGSKSIRFQLSGITE